MRTISSINKLKRKFFKFSTVHLLLVSIHRNYKFWVRSVCVAQLFVSLGHSILGGLLGFLAESNSAKVKK